MESRFYRRLPPTNNACQSIITMKKDCKFCDKKGLMILPLRYSVALADDMKNLSGIPALPALLGNGVSDLALTQGKYVPAMLRPGYLYVLIDREGIKSWECYLVTEDAYLYKFPEDAPPATKIQFTCAPDICGIDASMVSIEHASEIEKVYFLFTPSPLTKDKLAEYKKDPDGMVAKKKMQVFNPKAWLDGTTKQPHAMLADEVHKNTTEWILHNQGEQARNSPLGRCLENQLFPPAPSAYPDLEKNGNKPAADRLKPLYQSMRRRGAASFVVYDHIGITQELNDFRNDALAPIEAFLNKKDKNQISNESKSAVYEAIQEVKNGIETAAIIDNKAFLDHSRDWSEQRQENRLSQARMLRAHGRTKEAEAIEADVSTLRATRDKNYAKLMQEAKANAPKRWQDKYAPLLDTDEMTALSTGLNTVIDTAKQNASAARADNHLTWLMAGRLYDAFDAYDPLQPKSGFDFQAQAAACTFGMGGIEKCADQLDKWITSPTIDRKNLFMRAFTFNQRNIIKEAEQAIAQAKQAAAGTPTPDMINWALVQKSAKGLIGAFKSVDSAWDEYIRNTKQTGAGFNSKFEALAYQKISEIGRTVFRKGLGNAVDVKLVAGLGAVLCGRTGLVAEQLRLEELMYRIDPENAHKPRMVEIDDPKNPGKKIKVPGPNVATTTETGTPRQIDSKAAAARAKEAGERVAKTLDDALAKGHTSNFHQIRVGAIVTLLEAINFTSQSLKSNKTSEDYLKQTGAAFALIGASLDLAYTGAKLIRENAPDIASAEGASRAAIRGAGETVRGGLKLASGFFSCGAGLIGAWFDWQAADNEKNSNWLFAIYKIRAVVSFGGGILAIIAGLSYCGTWVTRLSLKVAEKSAAKGAAIVAAEGLVKLGERVALLRWVARLNLAGLTFTVGEIGVRLFILDDALESWCKRCVFRKVKSGIWGKDPYSTTEEEIKTLYSAYQEIK